MTLLAFVASACLVLPSHSHVVDPFRAPPCDRCAGNRGLDLATTPGRAVGAGVSGIVTFAGQVGGRLYVVVRSSHDRRLRVTYGGLATVSVRRGERVAQGQRVGTTADTLFFGTRVGERYVDPLSLASRGNPEPGATSEPRVSSAQRRPAEPRFRITLVPVGWAACAT